MRGAALWSSGGRLRLPQLLLVLPGIALIIIALVVPIASILVFSFWRTQSYTLIPDFTFANYHRLMTDTAYWTLYLRSVGLAVVVSLVCLLYAWPVAYGCAKFGGRYKLLLILLMAAPFFTGLILRVEAMQSILGPTGLINMGLMTMGFAPVKALMFSRTAAGIGLTYIYLPFMVTAIYLSLLNFNFELVEVAKINGATAWRAFVEVTLPLNRIGTTIGVIMVFVPCLADSVTSRFLGGTHGVGFASNLTVQFGETGTWALGSAMGVVLFLTSMVVVLGGLKSMNLERSGFTGERR